MRLGGLSSPSPGVLQGVQQTRRLSTADSPFHDVDLSDPPRPRASAGFAATAKAALEAFGSAAGGVFSSLKGKLSTVKDNVFDLASKAGHGLASAARAMGREASALLGGLSSLARAAAPPPSTPLSADAVAGHLKSSYEAVKTVADGMTEAGLGSFLRGSNEASRGARALGAQGYTDLHAKAMIAEASRMPPLALTAKAAARDGSSVFAAFAKDNRSDAEVARTAVDQAESMMSRIIGTPGDAASIRTAAAKVPQPLKDYLATVFRAIDDSSANPRLKPELKQHAARDALFLRTVNGEFGNVTGDFSKTPARNRLEMANVMQLMVNGKDLGSKHSEASRAITAGFGAKWGDAFQAFAGEVAAGGKLTAVQQAAGGPPISAQFQAMIDEAEPL